MAQEKHENEYTILRVKRLVNDTGFTGVSVFLHNETEWMGTTFSTWSGSEMVSAKMTFSESLILALQRSIDLRAERDLEKGYCKVYAKNSSQNFCYLERLVIEVFNVSRTYS